MKHLLIACSIFLPSMLMAQENVKQKEVGLVFYGTHSFGITYRTGTQKALWRFNTVYLNGNKSNQTSDTLYDKSNSSGFGFRFGREYRKPIMEKMEFRYGVDLNFSYTRTQTAYQNYNNYSKRSDDRTEYMPGVNLVIGLNYKINNNFIIGAEMLPGFSYRTGTRTAQDIYYVNGNYQERTTKYDLSGWNFGLSNNSVLMSLMYRF